MTITQDTGPDLDANAASNGARAGLHHIMEAVSLELVDLGHAGTALQATLSPIRRPEYEGLQTLDLLTQRLFALAEFVATLAPTIDAGCRADLAPALATICLSDMAARLAQGSFATGSAERNVPSPPDVETGVMDLF